MLGSAPGDTIPFAALLAQPGGPLREPADPDAVALLPYSSGTTGLAKGVMLTHRACLTNVVQMPRRVPSAPPTGCWRWRRSSTPSGWSCSPAGAWLAVRPWSRCPGST